MINYELALRAFEKAKDAFYALKNARESEEFQQVLEKVDEASDKIVAVAEDVSEIGVLMLEIYQEYFRPQNRGLLHAPESLEEVQSRAELVELIANQLAAEDAGRA